MNRFFIAILTVVVNHFPSAYAGLPNPLLGDLTCNWGSEDCNACVNDVEYSFANLEDGYTDQRMMRFDANDDNNIENVQPELTNAWSEGRHIQGMGRLPIQGPPTFVFSRNTGLAEWGEAPGVFSAIFDEYQSDGGNLTDVTTENDAENRAVAYITTDDDSGLSLDLDAVDHTGGLQTIGTWVVAGSGCVNDGHYCGNIDGRIDFFNFSDPYSPTLDNRFVPTEFTSGGDPGIVGITRLDGGQYLMTVNGTYWYKSDTDDLNVTGWSLATTFSPSTVVDESGDGDTWLYNPQNMNLLTECGTGAIYLIATDDSDGEDQAALYIVESDGAGSVSLTKRDHLRSPDKDGSDDSQITFDACANVYVTAEGQLTLYASGKAESDSDGDVRVMEFYNYLNCCNDIYETSTGRTQFTTCDRGVYFDDDLDGSTDYDGDCDDTDGVTFPGAAYNEASTSVCRTDADADGYGDDTPTSGVTAGSDCDDTSSDINPGEDEAWYDGIDEDCRGDSDFDADGDGQDADLFSGSDCDDYDATIFLGATETWYDGVDSDCGEDSDYDADRDGQESDGFGGSDCDDQESRTHYGAPDVWYDGVDSDCYGNSDYDADADGFNSAEFGWDDCDDSDPSINPRATEIPYNGIDEDCRWGDEHDADGDGQDALSMGGTDCDDANINIYDGASETWYDGVDSDCNGGSDFDADGDGQDIDSSGGQDCSDADPEIYSGAPEIWSDGIDQDCDGIDNQDPHGMSDTADCQEGSDDTGRCSDEGAGDSTEADGCGCQAVQRPLDLFALLLVLAAAGTRRRR